MILFKQLYLTNFQVGQINLVECGNFEEDRKIKIPFVLLPISKYPSDGLNLFLITPYFS